MSFLVEIIVMNKESVLNPEAKAIKNALESIGFEGIRSLRYGKFYSYRTDMKTKKDARIQAEERCKKYFADLTVNEEYEISSVEEVKE